MLAHNPIIKLLHVYPIDLKIRVLVYIYNVTCVLKAKSMTMKIGHSLVTYYDLQYMYSTFIFGSICMYMYIPL